MASSRCIGSRKFKCRMLLCDTDVPHPSPSHPPRSVCAATHAILSLAVSAYALLHRDLSACEGRAFCFDDMTARMLTVRAEAAFGPCHAAFG